MIDMQKPALSLDHLKKSYDGVEVVKSLSFTIESGEIFGLLGPNGAGKSTAINMVSGVTRIDAGTVQILGHDNRKDYRITRCLTGVMPQEIVIDNFFTIDNALKMHSGYYGLKDDPAWRSLLIDRLGLGPHLHKVMYKLSGGLKRRFMIAKALIHKPRLLILDEPTAGVDIDLRLTLWDFVREINQRGTTVLLTTHYLEEAEQMCGRIAIMNQGELVALDSTKSLLSRLGGRQVTADFDRPIEQIPVELDLFRPVLVNAGRALRFALSAGETTIDLLDKIRGLGLVVTEIETRPPNLEDVFLRLTGSKNNGK